MSMASGMGWAQQHSHRHMLHSSFWGTLCCPEVHASSTPLPPCSHYGVGFYIRTKPKVTFAHEHIHGGGKPDIQVLVQPPSQSRVKLCAQSSSLMAFFWNLPWKETVQSLQAVWSKPDCPCGNLFCVTTKSCPRATAGNTQDGQFYWTVTGEASFILPTIILEVSSSGHVGQEQIFLCRNPLLRLSPSRTWPDGLVVQDSCCYLRLQHPVRVAETQVPGLATDTMEIIINFCWVGCLFVFKIQSEILFFPGP